MGLKRGFRTSEVARLTGLTRRQLDHWDRTGLFKPSLAPAEGRGSARFYSFLDVVQLRVVKQLLDAGLSSRKLRACLEFLRNNLQEENLAGASLVARGGELFLLTDRPDFAVDLARSGQLVWLVDIGATAQEIAEQRKKLEDIAK
ncbi:MAG: MerR family transcriptional regulator [Bacillota bacterium]|jgi:DNA-binding transcriptional MerR regulator